MVHTIAMHIYENKLHLRQSVMWFYYEVMRGERSLSSSWKEPELKKGAAKQPNERHKKQV